MALQAPQEECDGGVCKGPGAAPHLVGTSRLLPSCTHSLTLLITDGCRQRALDKSIRLLLYID